MNMLKRCVAPVLTGAVILGVAALAFAQFSTYDTSIRYRFRNGFATGDSGNVVAQMQHGRVTTGSCGTGGCSITLTWGVPFLSTSYTASCTVEDSTAVTELALQVLKVRSKATTNVVVDVANLSAGAITGTLHCMAMAD